MADMSRNVELEIRAVDRTGKTFKNLQHTVQALTDEFKDQERAAKKGTANMERYGAAIKELGKAADGIAELRKSLATFEKTSQAVSAMSADMKRLKDTQATLNAEISRTGVATREQISSIRANAKAIDALNGKLQSAKSSWNAQRVELRLLGVSTKDVVKSQQQLVDAQNKALSAIVKQRNAQQQLNATNEAAAKINAAQRAKYDEQHAKVRQRIKDLQDEKKAIAEAQKNAARGQAERRTAYASQVAQTTATQTGYNTKASEINAQRQSLSKLAAEQKAYAEATKKSASAIREALEPQQHYVKSLNDVRQAAVNARKTYKDLSASYDDVAKVAEELVVAQKRLVSLSNTVDDFRRAQTEARRLATEYRNLQNAQRTLTANVHNGQGTSANFAAMQRNVETMNRLGAEYTKQRALMNQYGATLREAGVNVNNLDAAQHRLIATARLSGAAMRNLNERMDSTANASGRMATGLMRGVNSSRTSLNFFQRLRGQVIALTAAYIGLNGAIELFNKVIQAGKDEYRLKVSAEILNKNDWAKDMTGGVEQYFRETAERMGLTLRDVVKDGTKFFIAAKEAGRDAQQVMYTWEQFSGLGQVLGLSTEEMGRVNKALEQMFSKGTVSAEELKQQLGDVLPNATALFAKALNVTTGELMNMLKAGEVSADVLPLVAAEIEKAYGTEIQAAVHTLQAEQNRLNNSWQDWLRLINDAGVADNFKQLIVELTAFFRSDEGRAWALRIAAGLNLVIDALRWCVEHSNLLITALGMLGGMVVVQSVTSLALAFRLMAFNLVAVGKNIASVVSALGRMTGVLSSGAGATGFVATLGTLLKTLLRIAPIVTVVIGLVEALWEEFGANITAEEAFNAIADSLWIVGQAVDAVSSAIKTVFVSAIRAVKTVASGVFSFLRWGWNAVGSDSKSASKTVQRDWKTTHVTLENGFSGFIQVVARGLDALISGFKIGFIQLGQFIDVTVRKAKGLFTGEKASYDEIDQSAIAKQVMDETEVNGYEAAYKKIVKARQDAKKEVDKISLAGTVAPDLNELKAKSKGKDDGKAQEKAQKEAEKLEKMREQAERARERAEAAALKRLNKMLDVQKALEHYIKAMNSKEVMGSWEDSFTRELNATKQKFAAPVEQQQQPKFDAKGVVETAGDTTEKVASKVTKAAEIATKRTAQFVRETTRGSTAAMMEYTGACATAVKQALNIAGFKYVAGHGADTARSLINSRQGFQEVEYDQNYKPKKGDVMSLPRGFGQHAQYGHVAIFNGKEWVSDAVQRIRGNTAATNDASWANIKSGKSKPTIARHTGVNGGGVLRGAARGGGSYADQKAYYDDVRRESQISNQYEDLLESRDKIAKELVDKANEVIKDMFKSDGVTIDALVSTKSIEATLDGSIEMGDLSQQFAKTIEPQYKKQAQETAALLYMQLSKEHGENTAKTMVDAFKPKIEELYSRKASKEFEEIIDSRISAIMEKANKSNESRSEFAELAQSQVMSGAITPADAMKQMLSYDEKRTSEIKKQIDILEAFLASDALGKISDAALTKYRAQIAQLRKGITNPAETTDPTDSSEQVNKFAEAYAQRIEALLAAKNSIESKYTSMVGAGLISQADAATKMKDEMSQINAELENMATQGQVAYGTMSALLDPAKATQFADAIRNARLESQTMGLETRLLKETGAQMLQGFNTGFDMLAQSIAGIATGQQSAADAMKNLKNAFLSWASQFLMKIAQMILQQAIFNALQGAAGKSGGGGFGSMLSGALSAMGSLFHTGGVVGGGKQWRREVNPLVFAGAPRYHTGGIAGLQPNEVPAILQKGEEVITQQDPRHRDNGGMDSSGSRQPMTIINTFDPVDAVQKAFASKKGQKVLVQASGKQRKAFRNM